MKINVYLPNDISEQAKAAGINITGTLRAAIVNEICGIEQQCELEDEMKSVELELMGAAGQYIGHFEGVEISTGNGDNRVLLTDDERVLVFNADNKEIVEIEVADA